MRCFQCSAARHVQQRCPSQIDRAHCCCNEPGHVAALCRSRPRYLACVEKGRNANHRPEDPGCCPVPPRREGNNRCRPVGRPRSPWTKRLRTAPRSRQRILPRFCPSGASQTTTSSSSCSPPGKKVARWPAPQSLIRVSDRGSAPTPRLK